MGDTAPVKLGDARHDPRRPQVPGMIIGGGDHGDAQAAQAIDHFRSRRMEHFPAPRRRAGTGDIDRSLEVGEYHIGAVQPVGYGRSAGPSNGAKILLDQRLPQQHYAQGRATVCHGCRCHAKPGKGAECAQQLPPIRMVSHRSPRLFGRTP